MEDRHSSTNNPRVSVVVPSFNYAHFLPETLDSVLAQTFKSFELIVVDDGSTDNTKEVMKPYLNDPRVRYVYQENRGPSAARNTGIRESRGQLIAFVDPDDLWYPTKLQKQLALMESGEIGLCYCLAEHIDEAGNPLPDISFPHPPGATYKDLLYVNWIVGSSSSVLVRKEIFDEAGLFDESMKGLEDLDMWIRILRRHKSAYVNEVLVKLRQHLKSKHASKRFDFEKREAEYLGHVQRYVERFPELRQYRAEAYHHIYEGLLYTGYVYGRKWEMLKYYLKAGLYRPSFFFTSVITYLKKYFLRKKRFY